MQTSKVNLYSYYRNLLLRLPLFSERALVTPLRFFAVGITNNLVYYLLYIGFTAVGIGAKMAATIVFVIGILYSFMLNRKLVFYDDGLSRYVFLRYTLVYVGAWAVNMFCLELFTSYWKFDNRIVQAILMLLIGFGIFCALRQFVFRGDRA